MFKAIVFSLFCRSWPAGGVMRAWPGHVSGRIKNRIYPAARCLRDISYPYIKVAERVLFCLRVSLLLHGTLIELEEGGQEDAA